MNRKNRAQSSSLFLLELILAILFFSLASAVCVQFFVKSHLLSRDARNINHAVNECSGVAELVTASDGIEDAMNLIRGVYAEAETVSDTSAIRIYYDDSLTPCSAGDGTYVLQALFTEEDRMLTAHISMDSTEEIQREEPIYQLTAEHYLQRRPSDE